MKRPSFAAAFASAALFGCAAQAQTYQDWSGTIIPGVTNVPFPYTHLGPGQYNFTPSTATSLTPPSGARYAVVCSKVGAPQAEYTTDGQTTPGPSIGQDLPAGQCVQLLGADVIASFRIYSAGRLNAEYFK
jgi:hypothetical protein